MARAHQRFSSLVSTLAVVLMLGGCSFMATVEVKPSDCINPTASGCSGAANESRILEVRLYQLKQQVDPCQLDLDVFTGGKDLEVLKSSLIETPRSDVVRWVFNVAAGESRNAGSWQIQKDTQYVLAVAVGRGKSKNTIQLIPRERLRSSRGHFPTLYFKGHDICINQPCDVYLEARCPQ